MLKSIFDQSLETTIRHHINSQAYVCVVEVRHEMIDINYFYSVAMHHAGEIPFNLQKELCVILREYYFHNENLHGEGRKS